MLVYRVSRKAKKGNSAELYTKSVLINTGLQPGDQQATMEKETVSTVPGCR